MTDDRPREYSRWQGDTDHPWPGVVIAKGKARYRYLAEGDSCPYMPTDVTCFVQQDVHEPHIRKPHAAKMKIRNGARLILQGLEELWGLPRSFETKGEQGRRK